MEKILKIEAAAAFLTKFPNTDMMEHEDKNVVCAPCNNQDEEQLALAILSDHLGDGEVGGAGIERGTGHQSVFMNFLHYYPGLNR